MSLAKGHPGGGIQGDAEDQQDADEAGRPGPTVQGGPDDTPLVRDLLRAHTSPCGVDTALTALVVRSAVSNEQRYGP